MQILLKSDFTINWATLASLLIGIVLGAVLFVLIYTLVTLRSIKNSTYIVDDMIKDVSFDEVNVEISKAQKEFLIRRDEEKGVKWDTIRDIVINMIKTIAGKFYPNSKEPIAELTMEELIMLDRYIVSKIEELLNKRGYKPLQKIRLSTIINIMNAKNAVENSKVVKGIKKTGFNKIISSAYTVLNAINPAVWFKKLVINPSINLVVKQICLTIIRVIGQETYHVYSKQVFLEPMDDKEIEELLKEFDHQDEEVELIETK